MKHSLLLFSLLFLFHCGSEDKKDVRQVDSISNEWIDWENVAQTYHPDIEEIKFKLNSSKKITLNINGFVKDVSLIYSDSVSQNTAFIRAYRVWNKDPSWADIIIKSKADEVSLVTRGSSSCSINVVNGKIIDLEGGCYIKVEILLPKQKQIEVYNVGELLSQKFYPTSFDDFFNKLSRSLFDSSKIKNVEDFIRSYKSFNQKLEISSTDLGDVIDELSFGQGKLDVLRKLYIFVKDKNNLETMVEKEFSYPYLEKALQIIRS